MQTCGKSFHLVTNTGDVGHPRTSLTSNFPVSYPRQTALGRVSYEQSMWFLSFLIQNMQSQE